MSALQYTEHPFLTNSVFLAAWGGWPDAAESATRSLRELARQISATKFASIDPEEFYDFGEQRPVISNESDGSRKLSWPKNEFYYWKADDGGRDLLIFIGIEPNLKWRTYTDLIHKVVSESDTKILVTVGALLDSVPHTRSPRVTGSSLNPDLGPGFEHIKYVIPNYEGPSGITSVLMDRLSEDTIPSASIWGHSPHYLQVAQNPTLTHAILSELQQFISAPIDLTKLAEEAGEFDENLVRALADQQEIEGYVKRLEERYDSEEEFHQSPEPAALVQELEDFLRQQRGPEDPTDDGDNDD
ncbi:MAG: PAC2 family protein [Dehalococcoidia bacterium]|nr:PAC2 family protein [Dehalococcoidia bacterium]MDP7261446.1 PAC2 family protein [Dehalococcoidia bacterium]MDP7486152.1 PAC2 family protein [Dehalococcoidia bacterium]